MEIHYKKSHGFAKGERKLYLDQDPADGPIMLVRVFDWQEKLVRFLQESVTEGVKCDWEFHHCASWTLLGVEEITGMDFYEPWREFDIKTALDAYKALRKMGYSTLEEAFEVQFVEKPLILANRGDIVFSPVPEYSSLNLGMPTAAGLAVPPFGYFLGEKGVGTIPLSECTRCFSVGSLG